MCILAPCLIFYAYHIKTVELKRKADFKLSREAVHLLTQQLAETDSPITLTKPEHWYIIWEHDGDIAERSANAPALSTPPIPSDDLDKVWLDGSRVHFLLSPDQHSIIAVGLPKAPIDAKALRFTLALTSLFIVICPLIIYLSNRSAIRALKPIDDMTHIAGSIRDGDYKMRIDEQAAKVELKELAQILNQAFDHIDSTLDIQRQFTSNASHELRTPISILLLELESAIHNDLTKDELNTRLMHCIETAQKMEKLAGSMLKIARLESGELTLNKRETDLTLFLQASLQSLRPLTEKKGITLSDELQSCTAHIDTDALAQVITNLVSNAVSHTPEGGSIFVTLSSEGSCAIITLSDTGSGIPADDLSHVFDRFYRADKARASTENRSGLGLAICQSIILAHNGTIHVDSTEGKGTMVTLKLPIE